MLQTDRYAACGRLVAHAGGAHDAFADASGKPRVEIESKLLPGGRIPDAGTRGGSGEFESEFGEADKPEAERIVGLP